MKYYLQVKNDGTITDTVTYPYANYVEYNTNGPLPIGVMGGWFKLENGVIVEYPELRPAPETSYADLVTRLSETELNLDLRLSMLELGL